MSVANRSLLGFRPKVTFWPRYCADVLSSAPSSPLTMRQPLGFNPWMMLASSRRTPSMSVSPSRCSAPMLVMTAMSGQGHFREVFDLAVVVRADLEHDVILNGSAGKIASGTPMSLLKLLGEIEPRLNGSRTLPMKCLVVVLPLLPQRR
jgi:hypothetical protein